ncbi:MAG: S41 family peptidase [Mariniphaga sp.]|nr:S41 family peptidase [Atribacterota bacterium]
MKKIAIFILTFIIISCHAQTDQKFNLGFEKHSNIESLSDGWVKWGTYELTIDSLNNSGRKSGKITSTENGQFGSIAYKIPANYSGNTIKLEGFMKILNVHDGYAGLLLRVDGNRSTLAFNNMKNENISGTKDWKKYSITLNYPEEAENIFIAGILTGKGEAWFDDFELTIDGVNVQTLKESVKPVYTNSNVEIPKLTSDLISDIELLGKVWGFLKYYHPKVANGNYNWDDELIRFLPNYLNKSEKILREELILHWIDSLGEIDECKTCKPTASNALIKPDLEWITTSTKNGALQNKLHYIYENRNQGYNFYVKINPFGAANPEFENERAYANMSYPDVGYRLLALYRYWNIINYFFPYKHLIDKEWNHTLREYIPIFVNAKDELEYEQAAIQIIGDIQDTHANLWGGNNKLEEWKGIYFAPVHLRFIESKLVVTDYYNPELKPETGLEIGDVITKIDGRNINDIVLELSKYYPASNEAARLRDISKDMLRSSKNEVEVEYLQNSILKTKKVKLYPKNELNIYHWYRKDDEQCYRIFDNNIGYITLMSIKDDDISNIKEELRNTKGIIIDIRNYPSTFVPFKLGSYFVSSSTPFVKFTNGNINNPGEFTYTKQLEIPGADNPYKGKLIVLVNELSQSQAEYTAMAFRAGDNTTIIGSTTAGADGNVSTIVLPGGLRTMISGIGVYYPDGTETQKVGIIPDIEVNPTINGIKNSKDELIEKAIEIILNK